MHEAAVRLGFANRGRRVAIGAAPLDKHVVGRQVRAAAQHRHPALPLQMVRCFYLQQVKQRGHQVDVAEPAADAPVPRAEHGCAQQQRHLDRLLVHQGLAQNAVIAHEFAVIRRKNHNGIVGLAAVVQSREDPGYRAIYQRHIAPIAGHQPAPASLRLQVQPVVFRGRVKSLHQPHDQRRVGRRGLPKARPGRQRLRGVIVVERPGVRRMGFQIADAQREWRVAALADVLGSLLAQKRRLGVFLRHGRLGVAREHALAEAFRVGREPLLNQEVVIRAEHC